MVFRHGYYPPKQTTVYSIWHLEFPQACTQTTPIRHLHVETKVFPLKNHLERRGTQFYSSTSDTSHPLHYMQIKKPTARHSHITPSTLYRNKYSSLPPFPQGYSTMTHIYTSLTNGYIGTLSPKSLLIAPPLPIREKESLLSRTERVAMARARCVHSLVFPTYTYRIGPVDFLWHRSTDSHAHPHATERQTY